MNNLMPEQRPDKNGKIVTRHVKADTPTGSASASIPPPTVSSTEPEMIVLPGKKVTPMTAADFETIADLLEMCGTYKSDDLAIVNSYIRDGDIDALRILKEHGQHVGFSLPDDVLRQTYALYGDERPADYADQIAAHIKIAETGNFDYFDISGNGEYEEVLRIIHENIDQADSIIRFFEDRGPDPDALRDYLSNEVVAVREGTL